MPIKRYLVEFFIALAAYVVAVLVVEALIERLENRLDLRKVTDPAGMRVKVAAQVDSHLEGVTMQAPALMAFGDVRQAVGGLECELFENFHGMTCKAGVSRAVCGCQCRVGA